MLNYIVYGHTSYLEILRVQTDYIRLQENTTLFINKNDLNIDDILSKYDRVIYYDDSKPYASRLIQCLNQIEDEYFIFLHDIDILLNADKPTLNILLDFMIKNNVDRVDLKQSPNLNSPEILKLNSLEQVSAGEVDNGVHLIKQVMTSDYIYNVNPSIWYKRAFLRLLTAFPNKTYRDIEGLDVQSFAKTLSIYKLHSKKIVKCGYFECLEVFTYLHISHSGKLLLLNNNFKTEYGQSYSDISDEYVKIVDKYNLRDSIKWVK